MRLQAVTICINFSDYLEAVIANRAHFDRWLVITVPTDYATHELCAQYGIECCNSLVLKPDGSNFDAAWGKSAVLNEALSQLDQEGWAVILDSDVLLPKHFRQRVEEIPLERGCLYGMSGRVVCHERRLFEAMRDCEPWNSAVERNVQALGYFNLFSLEHSLNRYPKRGFGLQPQHDDYLFTTSFSPEFRRTLPMTVLHTGPIRTHWQGRVQSRHTNAPGVLQPAFTFPVELTSILSNAKSCGSAAVIGYYPGGRWRQLATEFSQVFLFDHHQIHVRTGNPIQDADREALSMLWEKEAEASENMRLLGPHTANNLEQIPDNSIDLLYLPTDVNSRWITPALDAWQRKLKENAVICGELFGIPAWSDTTASITSIFGVPDSVTETGFWWKQCGKRTRKWRSCVHEASSIPSGAGVVLVSVQAEQLEAVFLSLFSLRKWWDGPINVLHWGSADGALAVACHLADARLCNVGLDPLAHLEAAIPVPDEVVWKLVNEGIATQPFDRACVLWQGMLAVGPLDTNFWNTSPCGDLELQPLIVERSIGGMSRRLAANCNARSYSAAADDKARILICGGDPAEWTDEAWEEWSMLKEEMLSMMGTEVRTRKGATVVTVVTADTIGDFQQNWLTWLFTEDTPVVLLLVGIAESDFWLPGNRRPSLIREISAEQVSDIKRVAGIIGDVCQTPDVILLPPTASASPGAELLLSDYWSHFEAVVHQPEYAADEERVSGNCFTPSATFGLVRVSLLRLIAQSQVPGLLKFRSMSMLLRILVEQQPDRFCMTDLGKQGWLVETGFDYVAESEFRTPILI